MIIGNGMMATKFAKYKNDKNIIIFASGVSNSKETRPSEFAREFDLLKDVVSKDSGKTIVYFSTSSMYDPIEKNSAYVQHKLEMENYIQNNVNKYYIFRISQVIGRAKNNTLINFLINNI